MAKVRSIRIRYTLRALLVFVTLFALWGGYHSERGRKERWALAVLSKYDGGCDWGPRRPRGNLDYCRYAYQRLTQTVWREPYITRASLHSPLDAEAVEALSALPHLESLSIDSAPFGRDGNGSHGRPKVDVPKGALERILENDRLIDLRLGLWRLSDEDCRTIARHSSLELLCLYTSDISEDGLAMAVALPRLRVLVLSDCKVTGEKLALVPGSSSLRRIHCDKTPVQIEFARFAAGCSNLHELHVWDQVTDDEFVAALGSHPSLCHLDLPACAITDDSVKHLASMPALEIVVVPKGMLSAEAIDGLKAAKPKLAVSQ